MIYPKGHKITRTKTNHLKKRNLILLMKKNVRRISQNPRSQYQREYPRHTRNFYNNNQGSSRFREKAKLQRKPNQRRQVLLAFQKTSYIQTSFLHLPLQHLAYYYTTKNENQTNQNRAVLRLIQNITEKSWHPDL